jgi:hypothetical protein
MSIAVILAPILTLCLALAQLAIAHKWSDKRTRRYRQVRAVLVLLLFASTAATVVVVRNQSDESRGLADQMSAMRADSARQASEAEGSIAAARGEVASLETEIRSLRLQLDPFVKAATARFPQLEPSSALQRLSDDLSALSTKTRQLEGEAQFLRQQVESVRDYSDVARLTFNGSEYVGGDITFSSPLMKIMEGTFTEVSPDRYRRVCTDVALTKYRKAIQVFPRFPFSHFWLALCLRDRGESSWQSLARSAYSIFERTTQIAGHQVSHDEAKSYLAELLKTP